MCFSLTWVMNIIIWLIVVGAVFAILKLFVPYLVSILSRVIGAEAAGLIVAVISIVIWAIIAIIVVYIVFSLISCLLGMSWGFPGLPHGR